MERYSKKYSSKWQSQYSEEFKRHVCTEFITGTLTRRAIEQKFKLGNSRLDCWLKNLGYNYSRPRLVSLSMPEPVSSTDPKKQESVEKLKRELEDAKLLAETYRRMIEVAEEELKISIRKKSNTK
jgi:hypothetical protein